MNHHTVFGDLRQRALAVYRVTTQSSEYLVGVHEVRGRKLVIVRGEQGGDREHVVVRDSDPRIGERSLFDVPVEEWVGHTLEVATMLSSTIVTAVPETDPAAVAAVGMDGKLAPNPWARPDPSAAASRGGGIALPPPPGMSNAPRIVPVAGRGTTPDASAVGGRGAGAVGSAVAKQVVVGNAAPAPAPPEVPYPQRHGGYAESVTQLLRSLARRDRIFDDLSGNRELLDRLRRALDEAVSLIEQIRRRDRK